MSTNGRKSEAEDPGNREGGKEDEKSHKKKKTGYKTERALKY